MTRVDSQSSTAESRVVTRRWLRDLEAGSWTDLALVSSITAVLGIRGYLELTGYPKIGGGSLHIAHMLWGGLLMLVALWMLLFFIGRRVRPVAAIIGGLGFGTFIDEVGKFVTHDNDYFFEPTVAIIYGVLVLGYVASRMIEHRFEPSQADQLANALRDLEEVLVDDLDEDERARILEHLDRANSDDPLVQALRERVATTTLVPKAHLHWSRRASTWLLSAYRRLAASDWFVRGAIVFFVGQLVVKLGYAGWLAWGKLRSGQELLPSMAMDVSEAGLLVSSVLSALFVADGIRVLLGGRRVAALRRFQGSVLVTLLLAQIFQFNLEQWSALTGLALHLLLFFALRFAIEHERDVVGPGL